MNLSQQLANAKQELAETIQQNLILGYKFDKDALKNDVAVTVEVKKAELAVEEKALAELKEIIGISLDDFEAKYQEIADKKKEAENNKTNVSIEKAKDLAENYDGKAQELKNKKEAQSEFTFDIPAAVQNDFYNIVASKAGSATGDEVAIYQNILKQATVDAEGEYAFTNGMKVNTTAAIKKSIINRL